MKTKLIFDTNSLVYCVQNKIDFFEEIRKEFGEAEIIVLEDVLMELKDLSLRPGRQRVPARVVLGILEGMEKHALKKIEDHRDLAVDEKILDWAKKEEFIIISNDREILKRAKREKLRFGQVSKRKILF